MACNHEEIPAEWLRMECLRMVMEAGEWPDMAMAIDAANGLVQFVRSGQKPAVNPDSQTYRGYAN